MQEKNGNKKIFQRENFAKLSYFRIIDPLQFSLSVYVPMSSLCLSQSILDLLNLRSYMLIYRGQITSSIFLVSFLIKVKRAIRQKVEILNDLLIKTGKLE